MFLRPYRFRVARVAVLPALVAGLTSLACGSGSEGPTNPGPPTVQRSPELDAVSLKSQHGGTSHEAGSNCMACHGPNGLGPGRFTVAGTAYTARRQPNPDAVITLATAPRGAGMVVLTLEADANGNFYTTEAVPLPEQSLFPTVTSRTTASINFMPFSTLSGACNNCHVGSNPVDLD